MRKRRRLRRMVNTVTAGVLMLTLSACGSSASGLRNSVTTEETKDNETTKAEEIVPLWGETEEQEVFSLYTELDNEDLDIVESALERYFSYVEVQEEFSLKSKGYGTFSISKYTKQNAVSLAEKLTEKPVLSELDQSFMEFYPELIAMIDCINTICEYADLNSYLDDDYAKAADFHQTLWELQGNYKELAEKFHTDFTQYSTDYLNNILMHSMEVDDQIRLEAVAALLAAKSMDEEFRIQEISDKNLLEADIERLQPLYEEFLVHVNAMLDQSKKSNDVAYFWEDYWDSVKETKTSLTLILQNIREGKKPTGNTSAGSDSVASFRAGLKDMVEDFDRMLQEERE